MCCFKRYVACYGAKFIYTNHRQSMCKTFMSHIVLRFPHFLCICFTCLSAALRQITTKNKQPRSYTTIKNVESDAQKLRETLYDTNKHRQLPENQQVKKVETRMDCRTHSVRNLYEEHKLKEDTTADKITKHFSNMRAGLFCRTRKRGSF